MRRKLDKMIVNWVKDDEELIEPYEWCEGDDIEIISSIQCIKVDQKTMYDFIYGCLQIFDPNFYNKVFAIGDGHYTLAIETNQEGKLCFFLFINQIIHFFSIFKVKNTTITQFPFLICFNC